MPFIIIFAAYAAAGSGFATGFTLTNRFWRNRGLS